MNIAEAMDYSRVFLVSGLEAGLLLSHASGFSREKIIAHPALRLNKKVVQNYTRDIQRRSRGEPVAYITGHKEFFGLDFFVEKGVLIPRPETELLVEEVLRRFSPSLSHPSPVTRHSACPAFPGSPVTRHLSPVIIDLGTGSGCIAVSLAKNLPDALLIAVDISVKALEVARKNAATHGVTNRIQFLKSSLLEGLSETPCEAIVANLPYGGTSENHLFSKEVTDFEPHTALFGGETGFELFDELFAQINKRKALPRFLAAEIGFSQRATLEQLIHKFFGNVSVVWKNDLAGLDRAFIIEFHV